MMSLRRETLAVGEQKACPSNFLLDPPAILEHMTGSVPSKRQKRYAKDPTEIHGIKRRQNEGLQAFMDQFKSLSSHIKGVPPALRILAFIHGHGHPKLAKKLNDKIPKTVDEMFERVWVFIRGEVTVGSAEATRTP
ncbi:hypothetical protein Tco_0868479 [Tanacetum coccineum]